MNIQNNIDIGIRTMKLKIYLFFTFLNKINERNKNIT